MTSIFGKSSGGTLDARQNQTLEELQLDGFWNKEERKIISTVLGMGKNKCINGVGTAQIGKTELPNGRARKEANHETYFV